MSPEQLSSIYECPLERAERWLPHLKQAMDDFEINTAQRIEAFIAQVGHESGRLVYVRELWSPAQCPWQERYEVRADLGNTEPGDGRKFLGRGLIQITGRANYRDCGKALGLPLEDQPELLEQPENAARSAGWFWKTRGLNTMADRGDFTGITKRINGGANGLTDRVAIWERAQAVLALGKA